MSLKESVIDIPQLLLYCGMEASPAAPFLTWSSAGFSGHSGVTSALSGSLRSACVESSSSVNLHQDSCVGSWFSYGTVKEHSALCIITFFHFTLDLGLGVSGFWRASALECVFLMDEGFLNWTGSCETICCLISAASSQCLSSSLKIVSRETKDASESGDVVSGFSCKCCSFEFCSVFVLVISRDFWVDSSLVWTSGLRSDESCCAGAEASLITLELISEKSNSLETSAKEKEILLSVFPARCLWSGVSSLTLLTGLAVIGLLSELLLSSCRRHNRRLVFLGGARITGGLWVDDESLWSSWISEEPVRSNHMCENADSGVVLHLYQSLVSVRILLKEIHTFIQQGCIKVTLITWQKIFILHKCCSFELSIHLRILKNKMHHSFHKNIVQHNCFQHW